MTQRGLFYFLATGIVWGIPYFFIAIANEAFSTASIVWLRVVMGAVILIPIAIKRGVLVQAFRQWKWVLVFAVLEMVFPWWFITEAEHSISTSFVGLMMTTIPFISAFIMGVLGEKAAWHPLTILGLVIGFTGVVSLIGLDALSGHIELLPVLMLAGAAIGYAVAPVIASRKMADTSTLAVIALAMVFVAVIYTPVAVPTLIADISAGVEVHQWVAVIILGVVCSALAFVLYFELFKIIGPRRSSLITYVNLLVATTLGVWLLNEPITQGIIVGFPMVVAGSYLAGKQHKPLKRHRSAE
ncbi:MAG: hypothetical protein RIS25_87 [Actinomycetota bacterium]